MRNEYKWKKIAHNVCGKKMVLIDPSSLVLKHGRHGAEALQEMQRLPVPQSCDERLVRDGLEAAESN